VHVVAYFSPVLTTVEGNEELLDLLVFFGRLEVVRDGVGRGHQPVLLLGVEDHVQHFPVELLVGQTVAAVVGEVGDVVGGLEDHEVLVGVTYPDAFDDHRAPFASTDVFPLEDG